jgi:DNA-binding transcriptional MerR regulator
MKNKSIKKLYYSISEVSKITGLKQYVLRFWETEFADLKPAKNRAGNRIYRLSDIKLIFLIKKLLYVDKYTIEGARQKLKTLYQLKSSQIAMPFQESKEDMVSALKKDLQEVMDILDGKE